MNINKIILALFLTITGVCLAEENASQLVVLYKGEIAAGQSVVAFIGHNDPNGQYAAKHCEELKSLYTAKEQIPYYCSTVVFKEFKPEIK
jgi:hypothetical protein